MVVKSLASRVRDSFEEDEMRGLADHYLELILSNWRDVQAAMRRTVVLLVVLILGFLVLVRAEGAEVAVVGIKVTDLSAILAVLPAVVSHLLYDFVVLANTRAIFRDTVDALTGLTYPSLHRNELEVLMGPASTMIWGSAAQIQLRTREPGRTFAILRAMSLALLLAVLLVPLLFFGYAYWELFVGDRADLLPAAASLAFTVFSATRAVLTLLDTQM
jgi:hypothetical protein